MKVCPVDGNCFAFETIEEFTQFFKEFAERNDEELNDKTCIEGNSGLSFVHIKNWIEYHGLENVYFEKANDNTIYSIDEFYFDVKNSIHNGRYDIGSPDEMSFQDGFMRIWFD